MPIVSSDLVSYGAANMAEDDSSTVGGAIDTAVKVDLIEIPGGSDTVECVSDGADTRTVTIVGRDATGAIQTDSIALNGTTPVTPASPTTFERILKITLSASDGSRTVTIREASGDAAICTLGPSITANRRMFYDSVSSGSPKDLYEKTFWKNEHGTLSLTSAVVQMTSHGSGPDTGMQLALDDAKDDTQTSTNRVTAPSGVSSFVDDGTDVIVPETGQKLDAGEAIGVWIRMRLGADNAAFKDTYTTRVSGNTA